MTQHRKILNIIAAIRESHPEMVNIFSFGGCYNLFSILRLIFPEAVAWTNADHVITQIGNKFYDITGVVKKTSNHFPLVYNRRSIRQMLKENYKLNDTTEEPT